MATETAPAAAKPASPYTRANPFPGKLTVNRSLCGEGSEKDTRHFEIDLTGWGLNYEVGDSMTVWPTNDPRLVDEILKAIGAKGDEPVKRPKGETTLREALLRDCRITQTTPKFLKDDRRARQCRAVAERASRSRAETGPRPLSLGHGSDRFPDRASVDQDFAAGICGCAGEIAAAPLLHLLEPEGASRPGAFHHRRRALRKPRPAAQEAFARLSWRSARRMCRSRFFQTRQNFACRKTATRRSSWWDRARASRLSAPICRNAKPSARKARTGSSSDRSTSTAIIFTGKNSSDSRAMEF